MQKIDISNRTVIFTVFFLISLWVLYQIRLVLILWFIAFILMTALNPIVVALEKWKVPRGVGIVIAFLLAISIISLVFAGIIPPFVEQTIILAKNYDKIIPETWAFQIDPDLFRQQIGTLSNNAVNVLRLAAGAFSNLFTVFSLLVLTFYFLVERQNLKHYLKKLIRNNDNEKTAEELINTIELRLGGWVRGEIALMLIVGFISFLGLSILQVPFALPLALLAGLLELIPNVGPTISAIPAIIIGLTISPAIALGVLILYLAVQQLENNIIVPLVMKQSVGINPMVTLMALMVGLTLGGVLGAILAVPFYITADIVIRHWYKNQQPPNSAQ